MTGLTFGLGTVYAGRLTPSPVIDDYIMPMVAELVRDQIALIILTELTNLKAIAEDLALNQPATLQGIQAQADLDNGIYNIIDKVFVEKGTHFMDEEMPGLNIYFGRSDYAENRGNTKTFQVSNTSYVIEMHTTSPHKKEGDVVEKGDKRSALNTHRTLGLIRGIIMSGPYVTLGTSFKSIVQRRFVRSLDVFQPDFQESDGKHGIIGVINLGVEFNEKGPSLKGEAITNAITEIEVRLLKDELGKVILIDV